MDIEKLSELRGMNKPILDIEDLMTAIIMICKLLRVCSLIGNYFLHVHILSIEVFIFLQ